MNCPQCDLPLNTEEIVNEHAEDYGFVKLPSMEQFEEWLGNSPVCNLVNQEMLNPDRELAVALHSFLQGGKHA